jgi:hypothetical protein
MGNTSFVGAHWVQNDSDFETAEHAKYAEWEIGTPALFRVFRLFRGLFLVSLRFFCFVVSLRSSRLCGEIGAGIWFGLASQQDFGFRTSAFLRPSTFGLGLPCPAS